MTFAVEQLDALTLLAERAAWEAGDLGYLLSKRQRTTLRKWRAKKPKRFILNWSRRGGKTRLLCAGAIEECLRRTKIRVVYAAPTQQMARDIVEAEIRELLEGPDGPRCEYTFNAQQLRWTFTKTGSSIKLAGCDGLNANRLRGRTADIVIIDEAAFVDDLTYVVESILEPQLITTNGVLVMSSTPPQSPEHPFRYYTINAKTAANDNGRWLYDECTLHEVQHLSEEQKREAIEKSGGLTSTTTKREYLCLFVTDAERALVPEYQIHKRFLERVLERPRYFDAYTIADTGFNDLTVVLFCYYHFALAALVVEHELVLRHASGAEVGRAVLAMEEQVWGKQKPLLRWADASPQVLADMREGSRTLDPETKEILREGIAFAAAEKQDSDAALNRLRSRVERHHLLIHPRCTTTIAHLEHGIWNKAKTDFERIKGEDGHHFDGVAAAKYAVRACRWGKNPSPQFSEEYNHAEQAMPPERYAEYREHQIQNATTQDGLLGALTRKSA